MLFCEENSCIFYNVLIFNILRTNNEEQRTKNVFLYVEIKGIIT